MPKLFCGDLPDGILKEIVAKRRQKKLSLNSIGYRLHLYSGYLKFKRQNEMADLLLISQGSLSGLIRDRNIPGADTIIRLYNIRKKGINVEWLLTGRYRD